MAKDTDNADELLDKILTSPWLRASWDTIKSAARRGDAGAQEAIRLLDLVVDKTMGDTLRELERLGWTWARVMIQPAEGDLLSTDVITPSPDLFIWALQCLPVGWELEVLERAPKRIPGPKKPQTARRWIRTIEQYYQKRAESPSLSFKRYCGDAELSYGYWRRVKAWYDGKLKPNPHKFPHKK